VEDEPLDFVVVSGDKPGEEATSTPAANDERADPDVWKFNVVDRSSDDGRSITTQELFGDLADAKPAKKRPTPHRRPFSFLIPGVHLLGKPRTVRDTPAELSEQTTSSDKTDIDNSADSGTAEAIAPAPEPVPLKPGGTGWNIRVTAESVIAPDSATSGSPTLELDLTPPNSTVQISLRWVAAIPRTYVPALDPGKPLPHSRRRRLLVFRSRLAATARLLPRLALTLVSATGQRTITAVRAIGMRVKVHPHPIHMSRRMLIIAALSGIAFIGAVSVVAVTVANHTNPKPAAQVHRAASAVSVLTATAEATPAATASPPTSPTAAPPSAAAAPAPIHVVLAPVHNATPAPTARPAPTPTPVPTPTPPVQLSDSASGYLSTSAGVHTCSPYSGFTAASLAGPDGFTRSCTYTFTENVAGVISAKLTSTGDPLGSSPVVQAGGYCVLLYGASGTTPLVKTCTSANSSGPASLTQNTSTLSQTTGTFRIEVEAISAKTAFTFSLTHY